MVDMRIRFDKLWEKLSHRFGEEEASIGEVPNYIIRLNSGLLKVRVGDYGSGIDDQFKRKRSDTYSDVVCMSRHFVNKPIYTIKVAYISKDSVFTLKTTNDHTCAVYTKNYSELLDAIRNHYCVDMSLEKYQLTNLIEFKAAKDLRVGDTVPFLEVPMEEDCPLFRHNTEEYGFDGETEYAKTDLGFIRSYSCDGLATVISVDEDKNEDGCWVYDLEVASGRHVYYANNVLVHNSQFINLSPVTQSKCREAGISEDTRFSELPPSVKQNVIDDAYHILDLVNANVEKLINTNCYTSHGNVLHYALEYIASEGFYFKKKHYIVHKIINDDKPCDKFKYSGISVKKAEIPASMKTFLKDIYESTMKNKWSEDDYIREVNEAYRKFITLDWEQMSYYKKLRTPKASLSLTKSEKGAGAHARAANFYNGLLDELQIGGKYPVIGVGDEMRYSYILPTNPYGQDVVGFKGVFPEEFKKLFKQDYNKMFEKIFTKSLENYVKIMNYTTFDPTKSVEDASFDIF